MKTNQFLSAIWITGLICFSMNVFSQQMIITKNGDKINVKKWKPASKFQLKYKVSDKSNPDFQFVNLSDVYFIKDKKGNGLAFSDKGDVFKIKKVDRFNEMELQGAVDACKYFRKSGPFWGTWVPSFLIMPVGLVTAVAVSSTKPKKSLIIPANELVSNQVYIQSYKDQAHECKKQAAWNGFASGFGLSLSIGVLLMAL